MERRNFGEGLGNRPDMAYFLLLGLCGAAFLLTIGGILTYVAFNPGSIDGHPHSALSHIPHFHHHTFSHHPNPHHPGFHHPGEIHHPAQQHHEHEHDHSASVNVSGNVNPNHTLVHHTSVTGTAIITNVSEASNSNSSISGNSSTSTSTLKSDTARQITVIQDSKSTTTTPTPTTPPSPHHSSNPVIHPVQIHHDPNTNSSSARMEAAYEAKAKQSLILAIIGPLCILLGIVVTIIVGVLALKYDCDHEPEPNISFLRLRSEMSLNFDPDKNNYELLRPSSSIEQAGGHFSINPTGLPDASS